MMDKYVCVIGGINIDIKGIANSQIQTGESNEGHIHLNSGGVARNIAENLALLDIPVYLLGCTGTDYFGDFIIEETSKAGVNRDLIIRSDEAVSSKYLSVTGNDGNMIYGLNDMKDSLKHITIEYVDDNLQLLKESCFIIADTNLSSTILNKVVSIGNQFSIPVFIVPIS